MTRIPLLIATRNAHKAREFARILPPQFELRTLADFPGAPDPEETGTTFEANAAIKAESISAVFPGLVAFWVPTEAEQKVAEFKQQRLQNEENRRAELMKQLLGNRKPTTTKKPVARAEEKNDTQQEERPMMKIKVWRDDPKASVKTLPDVVSDMI